MSCERIFAILFAGMLLFAAMQEEKKSPLQFLSYSRTKVLWGFKIT